MADNYCLLSPKEKKCPNFKNLKWRNWKLDQFNEFTPLNMLRAAFYTSKHLKHWTDQGLYLHKTLSL